MIRKASSPLEGQRGRLLISLLVVAALLLALLWVSDITYETNDDCMIAAVTSGALTGSPHPATVYTSYLYGLLLCGLHGISAVMPWHGAVLMALNALSLTVILYCLLGVCKERGLPGIIGIFAFVGLFLGVYLMFVAQLQFTAVSGMAFLSSLMLAMCKSCRATGRRRCARWMACGFFLLFSFLLRPKVTLLLLPFAAVFALAELVRCRSVRNEAVAFFCCALVGVALLWLTDGLLYGAEPGWQAYRAYDRETTAFLDYHAYALTGEQEQTALKAAHWSDGLFGLARDWYFLDERINTEALHELNLALDAAGTPMPMGERLGDALYAAASVIRRYPFFGLCFLGYALAAAVVLTASLRRGKPWLAVWMLGSGALAVAEIVYFYGILNRFPLRLAFPVAALLYTSLLPCVAALVGKGDGGKPGTRAAAAALALLLCGSVLSFCIRGPEGLAPRNAFSSNRHNDRIMTSVSQYIGENAHMVYVTDLSIDFMPFSQLRPGAFANLIPWASGITGSPAAMRQLGLLGYESFDARQFFDPQVRLLLTRSPGAAERLERYLQADYGATGLALVEERDDFVVYQAVR